MRQMVINGKIRVVSFSKREALKCSKQLTTHDIGRKLKVYEPLMQGKEE